MDTGVIHDDGYQKENNKKLQVIGLERLGHESSFSGYLLASWSDFPSVYPYPSHSNGPEMF